MALGLTGEGREDPRLSVDVPVWAFSLYSSRRSLNVWSGEKFRLMYACLNGIISAEKRWRRRNPSPNSRRRVSLIMSSAMSGASVPEHIVPSLSSCWPFARSRATAASLAPTSSFRSLGLATISSNIFCGSVMIFWFLISSAALAFFSAPLSFAEFAADLRAPPPGFELDDACPRKPHPLACALACALALALGAGRDLELPSASSAFAFLMLVAFDEALGLGDDLPLPLPLFLPLPLPFCSSKSSSSSSSSIPSSSSSSSSPSSSSDSAMNSPSSSDSSTLDFRFLLPVVLTIAPTSSSSESTSPAPSTSISDMDNALDLRALGLRAGDLGPQSLLFIFLEGDVAPFSSRSLASGTFASDSSVPSGGPALNVRSHQCSSAWGAVVYLSNV
mmetsp:Transcript_62919/g.172438  ORF Transcript_62919/g.172438 Transcript_62919/m.172438 type:complete len:390 (-) Transcript_62919:154-1323(-)